MKAPVFVGIALVTGVLCIQAFDHENDDHQNGQSEFEFALIGDMPYNDATHNREPLFLNLVNEVNSDPSIQFVMHAGDIKAGHELCSNELIQHRFDLYQKFNVPFIYTPGDNEWTDCHRTDNGAYNPLERLRFVRQTFFPNPDYSTGGRKMKVFSETHVPGFNDFVENVWFGRNSVVFATVHVVGSTNDLNLWSGIGEVSLSPEHQAEFDSRKAADAKWLDQVFAAGQNAKAIFLIMQANPNFEGFNFVDQPKGFHDLLLQLHDKALAYGKPVAIAQGDNHVLLIDKPFDEESPDKYNPPVMNLTRVQTFGQSNVHWVKVYVDPKSADVFKFEPHIIKANLQ